MVDFELKLATLRYLLSKIDGYERFISNKNYERLSTRKYRNMFSDLRNSIECEIEQILELLKAEGIDNPSKTFLYGEVKKCLKNETELKGYIATLN